MNDRTAIVSLQPDDIQTVPAHSNWQRFRHTARGWLQHPRTSELFGIDVRGLAIYRIGLAILLLLDLAGRVPFLTDHYTDAGLVTRKLIIERMSRWQLSLYLMSGTTAFVAIMFLVAAAFALMLLVGYRTRLATVASWVLLVSLQYRNPLVNSAGDHVLRLLMFWGMFLPLGAAASVDSRLRGDVRDFRRPQSVLSMATLGLLLQIAFIYVFSAMLKTNPIWREQGTAIYYSLNLDRMVTPLGTWLAQFYGLCRVMTFATLGMEAVGPVLAFVPFGTRYLRTVVVCMFWGFHLGLALTMHLILFPFVCMAAWTVFLPPWFWDRVATTRLGMFADSAWCRFIEWTVKLLRFCGVESFEGRPVQNPYRTSRFLNIVAAICLVYVFGWNIHSVTKRSSLSFPPVVRRALNAIGWTGLAKAKVDSPPLSQLGREIGLNDRSIDAIAGIGTTLGIAQGWIMFSPYPPRDDGWWVAAATLADGQQVDLYRDGAAVRWDKPNSIAAEFRSHRCRKYMMSMWTKNRRYHAPYYSRWLRKQWNESHDDGRNVESLRLYYMLEYTQPPGEPPVNAKLLVHRWSESGGEKLVSYSANKKEYRQLLKRDKK